ncbi:MAG TPA: MucR family transcriptional regulator [Candidatus Dormibacteraeota bacterium]|nr:MucR family transcriptional regulator [Candidatus Dormibacteraeota bacterium]
MSDNPVIANTQSFVAQIVSGYVKKNHIPPADMPSLIAAVYQSLMALEKAPEPPPKDPAVPIRQSVRQNYVVCLECGRRGHMLRKDIQTAHGTTPEQYRAKWRLSPDHPLTAPAYSQRRSVLAKQLGLGKGATRRGRRRRSSS